MKYINVTFAGETQLRTAYFLAPPFTSCLKSRLTRNCMIHHATVMLTSFTNFI